MSTYFSDRFGIDPAKLEKYGAFNVSIVTDLPLFIDPFLLFNSRKPKYKELHGSIVKYLIFLRDKAQSGPIAEGLLRAWYCFPEVEQFRVGNAPNRATAGGEMSVSFTGDPTTGLAFPKQVTLGMGWGSTLRGRYTKVFIPCLLISAPSRSQKERILKRSVSSREGVGRDNISDFSRI